MAVRQTWQSNGRREFPIVKYLKIYFRNYDTYPVVGGIISIKHLIKMSDRNLIIL